MQSKFSHSLRMIWAIALKDINDAVRNKMTLSVLLGALFLMLSSMALPWMMMLKDTPTAIVYTAEKSTLVRALAARDEFKLRLANSAEEMYDAVGESTIPVLGMILPAEFNKEAGSGQVVQVEGVVPHWVNPAKATELATFFEQELSTASWQTIQIDVEGRVAYPAVDADGQPFTIAMNFTIVIIIMGLTLVPYLLVDEKETHAMDALLVSPVSLSQLVIGKALTGMFYCLTAAVVVFVFHARAFVHWEIAILAVVLGASFAVSVGLLIGSLCKNQSTITMWVGILLLVLMLPVFLYKYAGSQLPAFAQAIMPYTPSAAIHKLLVYSMAGTLDASLVWPGAAILAAIALIMLLLVMWHVRRSAR